MSRDLGNDEKMEQQQQRRLLDIVASKTSDRKEIRNQMLQGSVAFQGNTLNDI